MMQWLLIYSPFSWVWPTAAVLRHQISQFFTNPFQTLHFCWLNFDGLAQGNAYKPTKEPINYHGPGGDWTYDLQTEATLPAASFSVWSLHATEMASINTIPVTCLKLHWTTDNLSGMHRCQFQHLCVLILNCALELVIYIFVGLILMLWHRETHIKAHTLWNNIIYVCKWLFYLIRICT